MKSIIVTLAGVEYSVDPLPRAKAKAFRQRISEQLDGVTGALRDVNRADKIDVTDLDGIANLIQRVGGMAAGSIDLLADMLFDFSPVLAEDRERIEAECYDDEIIAAFAEVLKLLYPFGRLLNSLGTGR